MECIPIDQHPCICCRGALSAPSSILPETVSGFRVQVRVPLVHSDIECHHHLCPLCPQRVYHPDALTVHDQGLLTVGLLMRPGLTTLVLTVGHFTRVVPMTVNHLMLLDLLAVGHLMRIVHLHQKNLHRSRHHCHCPPFCPPVWA